MCFFFSIDGKRCSDAAMQGDQTCFEKRRENTEAVKTSWMHSGQAVWSFFVGGRDEERERGKRESARLHGPLGNAHVHTHKMS